MTPFFSIFKYHFLTDLQQIPSDFQKRSQIPTINCLLTFLFFGLFNTYWPTWAPIIFILLLILFVCCRWTSPFPLIQVDPVQMSHLTLHKYGTVSRSPTASNQDNVTPVPPKENSILRENWKLVQKNFVNSELGGGLG